MVQAVCTSLGRPLRIRYIDGGVSNVDIDGNNTLQIKAIGVVISTIETLPEKESMPKFCA